MYSFKVLFLYFGRHNGHLCHVKDWKGNRTYCIIIFNFILLTLRSRSNVWLNTYEITIIVDIAVTNEKWDWSIYWIIDSKRLICICTSIERKDWKWLSDKHMSWRTFVWQDKWPSACSLLVTIVSLIWLKKSLACMQYKYPSIFFSHPNPTFILIRWGSEFRHPFVSYILFFSSLPLWHFSFV
jgi:hypothetical protein